jgi:hypothetical protein
VDHVVAMEGLAEMQNVETTKGDHTATSLRLPSNDLLSTVKWLIECVGEDDSNLLTTGMKLATRETLLSLRVSSLRKYSVRMSSAKRYRIFSSWCKRR